MIHYGTASAAELHRRAAELASRPDTAYLAPIFSAAGAGAAIGFIPPDARPFRLPNDRPAILIIGDDSDTSVGPDGFHKPSLRRALRQAHGIAVMAGAPIAKVYASAAQVAAAVGADMVLIECQERTEGDWNAFVERTAPKVPRLIVTPRPEGSA